MAAKERYVLLDHTADLRVEIRGADLPSLFANAGYALFDLIADLSKVEDSEADEVSVTGDDTEDLLVRWMGELLYRYHVSRRLCKRFDRPVIEENALRCRTWGRPSILHGMGYPARSRPSPIMTSR